MGNSTGNLQEYWDAIDLYPRLQGGFIWDWVDQGLTNTADGVPYAYGGDFGDLPNDLELLLQRLIWPNRAPSRDVRDEEGPGAGQGNRRGPGPRPRACNQQAAVRRPGPLRISWTVSSDGQVLSSGTLPALDTPAGASVELPIPIEPVQAQPGAGTGWSVALAAPTPGRRRHEVAFGQFKLPVAVPAVSLLPSSIFHLPSVRP